MATHIRSLVLVGAGMVLVGMPAVRADGERGRLLYENHCQTCHESVVHIREQRKAKTPADLRAAIERWAAERKLTWGADEQADVYRYLNNRYYKFAAEIPAR